MSKPLDANWGKEADQMFVMACTVIGYEAYKLVEWWGRDETDAVFTFKEWLARRYTVIDQPFGHSDKVDIHIRPDALILAFIPVAGEKPKRVA